MKTNSLVLLVLLAATVLRAQTGSFAISSLAGVAGVSGTSDGQGAGIQFNLPRGLAYGPDGQLYVADAANHTIRRLTPAMVSTTVAGSPGLSGTVDGLGAAARFNSPGGLVVDGFGTLFIADTENHAIRMVTADGQVSTLAGRLGAAGAADGTGTAARFNRPIGIILTRAGELLVADTGNHTIRRVTLAGVVTTFAGAPGYARQQDGVGSAAAFVGPHGLALDPTGILYVTEPGSGTIRRVSPAGEVTSFVGLADGGNSADGVGASARFNRPSGITLASDGHLYVIDAGSYLVRRVTLQGVVSTVAGAAAPLRRAVDGAGGAARFQGPQEITATPDGALLVADTSNFTLRRVSLAGVVVTVAGTPGRLGSAEGTGAAASFNGPYGIAIDAGRNLYVADTLSHTIRRISPSGAVTTLAGAPEVGGFRDDVGGAARFYYPGAVAVRPNGDVVVADSGNHVIRVIAVTGQVNTLAGVPGAIGSADGVAGSARFFNPSGVAVEASGHVLVADTGNHVIRRIAADGTVSTLAGAAGRSAFQDGIGAAARFSSPYGIAVDRAGNIFVADSGNSALRRISPTGLVATLGGIQATAGYADGALSEARFRFPFGLAIDSGDNLYVADYGNNVVRRIAAAGFVSTIAGQAQVYGSTDGVGALARFYDPTGVAVDEAGVIYVVDSSNNLIRRGMPEKAPVILVQPSNLTVSAGGAAVMAVTAAAHPSPSFQWSRNGVPIAGATGDSLRLANVQVADAGLYSVLVANGLGSTPSASATLVVLADAPAIVRQPVDQTALVGSTATFTVEVAGAGLISYQWRRNGTNLPGATGGSLSLSFLQLIDSGTYDVVVSNSIGARVSTGAVLSVVDALAPVISAQPSGQTVKAGAVAELSVTASGTPPLVYWWARNGVVIPGATSSVLRMPAVTLGDSGVYTVSVANRAGTAVSVPARVTVTSPPVIVKQPISQAVSASESLTLAVQVAGTAPFRYQWRKEGIALPGATNASLLIARTTVTEAGGYSVLVSNDEGSVTSATATVQVIEPGFGASHVVVGSGYVPAGQIVVRSTLHFTGVPAAIGWQVLLPSGWSYVRDEGVPAPSKPTAGQQDLLEWSWPSPPASPITLEYTLRVPAGEAGAKQVVALMTIRGSDASSLAVLAKPDPLVVERSRTGTHSADSNQDGRISLLELTRVIELYNTRTGSVRTGEYRVQEGTEDGFAGGP